MKTMMLLAFTLASATLSAQQTFYDVTAGNGNGLRFWQNNTYKIHMGNTSEYQYGPVTGYSIKMNMSSDAGRGWTWGIAGLAPVAAINNVGNMQIAGSFFSGGHVGIGTTSPSNLQGWARVLDVRGGTDSKVIASTNNATYRTGIYAHSTWYGGGGLMGTESNHKLHLITNLDPKMTIDINGNIGVGTKTPTGLLEIKGPYAGASQLIINSTNSNAELRFSDNDIAKGFVWYNKTNDLMAFGRGNYTNSVVVNSVGNFGIGTANPTEKLTVHGTIYGKEIKVDISVPGPDYVFDTEYELQPLETLQKYIAANKHLPGIPSAKEMEANGINVGVMNMLLLEKIEELTLYLIDLKRENIEMKEEINTLKQNMQ